MNTVKRKESDMIDAPDLHSITGSGRVSFDDRGNSIWEWQTQPGVFTREISLEQLQQLEDRQLRLVDALPHRNFEGLWIHDTDRTSLLDTQPFFARRRAVAFQPTPPGNELKDSAFNRFMRRLRLPV